MKEEWQANEKFICIRCGKLDYTDYYCGGCDKCCGEILKEFWKFTGETNDPRK